MLHLCGVKKMSEVPVHGVNRVVAALGSETSFAGSVLNQDILHDA